MTFAHVARYVVYAFSVLLVLAYILSEASVIPSTHKSMPFSTATMLALISGGSLFVLTVAEFNVCGFRSLFFSTGFIGIVVGFAAIARHGDISDAVATFTIFLPLIWSLTTGLIHVLAGLLILPAQVTFGGVHGFLDKYKSFTEADLADAK